MIYLYTKTLCSACIELKKKYDEEGTEYTERDGDRLTSPVDDHDQIDCDALVQLSMNNMTFPITIEVENE